MIVVVDNVELELAVCSKRSDLFVFIEWILACARMRMNWLAQYSKSDIIDDVNDKQAISLGLSPDACCHTKFHPCSPFSVIFVQFSRAQ